MGEKSVKKVTLRWVHTSDLHGNMFMYDDLKCVRTHGGASAVYGYVESLRERYPDSVICTDGGDCLQGQPVSYYYNYIDRERNIVNEMMNAIGYDAATIGNHDIETGHPIYDKWLAKCNYPVLAANMIDIETEQPYLQPYAVIERCGVRIAILGMVTPTIDYWLPNSLWSGLRFQNMVECAQQWIPIIQEKEKPHLIVGLFHSGLEGGVESYHGLENSTKKVAENVPGFDLILYGHDHKNAVNTFYNAESKPVLTAAPNNNGARIVEAQIQLIMRGDEVLKKKIHASTPPLNGTVHPNSILLEIEYDDMRKDALEWLNEEIGTSCEELHETDAYFGPCSFINLIHQLQLEHTGADISFAAPLSFDSVIPKGKITVRDMFNLYRYENYLYTLRLSGKEIKDILELSYDRWTNTMQSADDHIMKLSYVLNNGQRLGFENLAFNFISAAGIRYEVDVTKPFGEKIRILELNDGRTFDLDNLYSVAVNSYHGSGGGDLLPRGSGIEKSELCKRIISETKEDLRSLFIKRIKETKDICPSQCSQWRFVPSEWTEEALIRDKKLLFKHYI